MTSALRFCIVEPRWVPFRVVQSAAVHQHCCQFCVLAMNTNLDEPMDSTVATPRERLRRTDLGLPIQRAAPFNWTEKHLVEIWESVLGVESIGIDDNFFDLGGDSLAAATIFDRMEQRFGVRLPLAELVTAGTIRMLATRVKNAELTSESEVVVPVRTTGDKAPLFLVHGLPGTVLFANLLATQLEPGTPVYGIQAPRQPSRDWGGRTEFTIENMAEEYVAEVRKVRPTGPFLLGGWCAGGVVALEMAQQLIANNEEVAALIIIDPPVVDNVTVFYDGRKLDPDSLLQTLSSRCDESVGATSATNDAGVQPIPSDGPGSDLFQAVFLRAFNMYRPRPYPGRILMLCSEARGKSLTSNTSWWGEVIRENNTAKAFWVSGATHESLFHEHLTFLTETIAHVL